MGNENESSPHKEKLINAMSEEEYSQEEKEKEHRRLSRLSSVKIKSYHLNKEQYIGQAIDGKKEGHGIYSYENGDKYDGNWKDNKKEGKGSYFYNETGEIYKGNFINDYPNGMGTFYYKNGDRYEGMFKDGKKYGQGTIIYANGGKFKGEFKNDEKHGKGEYKNYLGKVKYEFWDNGVLKSNNDNENIIIKENESNNLFNETSTKKYNEFLKTTTNRKKPIEKIPLLIMDKIKNIKEKTKNKINDQQLVQILNTIKEKPNAKSWTVDDIKTLFQKINLEKYIPLIESNSIDGKKLLFLDNQSIPNIFKLTDKNEIKIISLLIEFIDFISNNEQEKYKIDKIGEDNTNKKKTNSSKNCPSFNIDNFNNICKNFNLDKNNHIDNNNNFIKNKIKDVKIDKKKIIKNKKSKEKVNEKESELKKSSYKSLLSYSLKPKNEEYIKEMNKLGKTEFYSSLNNNSLNFFINYDEIKKEKILIGKGGMSHIYLGEWQGKQVALKKIKFEYTEKGFDIYLKKFINEINIIASMRHPNILLYMGTTVDNESYYMITEYLPMGSLEDYLHKRGGYLTDKQKIKIAFQIAIAIKYIHSRKILHCDLKSSNVLLDEDFNVKLSDFGLSNFMSECPEKTVNGTVKWMAPEILNRGKYETTADIFSFGLIIWELLTGKTPYYNIPKSMITKENLTNNAEAKFVNNEDIIPIPKSGNIVLRYIASKCLQYKPENRLTLDLILKYLSKANKCYEEIDEVAVEMFNFVS